MRVSFESSHVGGDFSSGVLTIGVTAEDHVAGATVHEVIHFSVPRDFHVHNDSVAAALLSLVGANYRSVGFNFGVSACCAEVLRDYYRLDEVGPVDPNLEPRRPGRHLGLNFSGGLDSTAVWVILDLLGDEFMVIHADYGFGYRREQTHTTAYRKDVDCTTDLREKGYDLNGRFLAAIPLLYADYVGLGSVTHGNPYFHYPPLHVESLAHRQAPAFLRHDAVFNAGGLAELHLIRGLMTWSTLRILVSTAPERVRGALAASARPGSVKHAIKALALRDTYQRLGLPLPEFLEPWIPPRQLPPFGQRLDVDTWALYFLKTRGPEFVGTFVNGIERVDRAAVDRLTFRFLTRYNPSLVQVIPADLRNRYLSLLHRFEVYPYDERDWYELEQYKALLDVERHAGPR
jgi:hypothetical protein